MQTVFVTIFGNMIGLFCIDLWEWFEHSSIFLLAVIWAIDIYVEFRELISLKFSLKKVRWWMTGSFSWCFFWSHLYPAKFFYKASPLYLFIYLFFYLLTYLFIYVFSYLFIHLFIYLKWQINKNTVYIYK